MIWDTLELQLGALDPDDPGGTQTGVILWSIVDCAFKVWPTGDSPSKGSHNKLLSVKLTWRWTSSWCIRIFCARVIWLCGNGCLRGLSNSYVRGNPSIVGRLESAITLLLDSMIISGCLLWSDTCSSPPSFLISLFLVIFHGDMGLGSLVRACMSCWGSTLSTMIT